jgi:hypothetical protein
MLQQQSTGARLIVAEAEGYVTALAQGGAEWVEGSSSDSSGGTAMQALPNAGGVADSGYETNSPRLDFRVAFAKTGTHYVWMRGRGVTGDGSVHVGLDGAGQEAGRAVSGFNADWTWSNTTIAGTVATVNVSDAGLHTLNVWMREDGFMLDKLVLTPSATYTPTGIGPDGTQLDDTSSGMMVSRQADLSDAFPLEGAELSGTVYLFFQQGADAQGRDLKEVDFYCCQGAGDPHVVYPIDTEAPYSIAVDLAQLTPGTTRELYADVVYDDPDAKYGVDVESYTVDFAVVEPTPALTLTAVPESVPYNGSTTLAWAATNADGCNADGDWTGAQPPDGTTTIGPLTQDATLTLNCSGAGGAVTHSVLVTVAPAESALMFSRQADLSDALPLEGAELSGTVYLFFQQGADTQGRDLKGIDFYCCQGAGDPHVPYPFDAEAPYSIAVDLDQLTPGTTRELYADVVYDDPEAKYGVDVESYTVHFDLSDSGATPGSTPPATVTLRASPTTVAYGQTTTLSWSSSHADSCQASGAWSGEKSMTGSELTAGLPAESAFTLTCSGAGGSASDSVTIAVAPPPVPEVSLAADPASVGYGGSTKLTWTATDATSCSASGGWTGTRAPSGTETMDALTQDGTFGISCAGPGGTAGKTVTVAVAAPPKPAVSLSASPSAVASDGNTTLTWSSSNASICAASGAWSGARATSGSETLGPLTSDSTFTLTCTGPEDAASDSVVVTVAKADSIPKARDDIATTPLGTSVDVAVIANDTGLDDAPLTLEVISAPTHGTAVVASPGTIRYTPAGSFAGQDSLSYRVKDADGDRTTATVVVVVTCNDCAAGRTLGLSWAPNSGSEGVKGYRVFYGPTATTANTQVSDVSVADSSFDTAAPSRDYDAWNDLGLRKEEQACFRVKAYNDAGSSEFSAAACVDL